MMILALRGLRLCYGSAQLSQESLLFKDQWQRMKEGKTVTIEGIGMAKTIKEYGIGWF